MTKSVVYKTLNLLVVVAMLFSAAVVSAKPAQAAADASPYANEVQILWPATGLVDTAHTEGTYSKPWGAYFKAGSTVVAQFVVGDPGSVYDTVTKTWSVCTPQEGWVRYWIGSTRAVSPAEYTGARWVANVCAITAAERTFSFPKKSPDGLYYFRVDVTTDPDPARWTDISWGKDVQANAVISDNTAPTGTLQTPTSPLATMDPPIVYTANDNFAGKKIFMRADYILTGKTPYATTARGSRWYRACQYPLVTVPMSALVTTANPFFPQWEAAQLASYGLTPAEFPASVLVDICPSALDGTIDPLVGPAYVDQDHVNWEVPSFHMSPFAALKIVLTDVAGNSTTLNSNTFEIIGADNSGPLVGLYQPGPTMSWVRGVFPIVAYANDPESGIINVKYQFALKTAPDTWLDIVEGGAYKFDPYMPMASIYGFGGDPAMSALGNHWYFFGWDTSKDSRLVPDQSVIRVRVVATNGAGIANDPNNTCALCNLAVSQWLLVKKAPITVEITRPLDGGTVHINGCGQISPLNASPDLPAYDTFRSLVTVRAKAVDSAAGIFRVEFSANGVNEWMPLYSSEAVSGIPDTYTAYMDTLGLVPGNSYTLMVRVWTGTDEWYPAYATFTVEDGASEYFGCSFEKEVIPGWNLISLPLIPDNSAVANVMKTATKASYVNTVDTWTWKTTLTSERYAPKVPVTTLTNMVDGKGYWVNVSDLTAISYAGSIANDPATVMPAYQVYKGWNLIGFTPWIDPTIGADWFFNQTVAQYLRPDLVSKTQAMYSFDPVVGLYVWTNLTDSMEAGMGYWLATSAEGVIFP